MKILTGPAVYRFREKGSVFLTELHPAADATARATILSAIRKRDHDATHHCSAWRTREMPFLSGLTGFPVVEHGHDDDGEPAGTAGAPMLKILKGCEIIDVLAICVRWYGGTKLGTGGLVRAYTEGVKGAVSEAERLSLFEQFKIMIEGAIEAPAEMAHLPFAVLGCFKNAEFIRQDFNADHPRTNGTPTVEPDERGTPVNASLTFFRLPPEDLAEFERAWAERSRGGYVQWSV